MKEKLRVFVSINVAVTAMTQWHDRLSELGHLKLLQQPHITLAFIGNLSMSQIQAINDQLDQIQAQQFNLRLTSSGHFNVNDKHIIWAGIEEHLALSQLRLQIINAINTVVPHSSESHFVPHVSLIRGKRFSTEELAEIDQALKTTQTTMLVTKFGLYRSEGSMYQIINEYSLSE